MTTILEARAAAGARYAAALEEWCAAIIELRALDIAAVNGNVLERGDGNFDASSFATFPRFIPEELRHPEFAAGFGPNLNDAAEARRDRIIARGP